MTQPIRWNVTESNCFECLSHTVKGKQNRYPRIMDFGTRKKVHRFIFEQCFGSIPDGMVVRHKCDNTLCINPEHLELGTQSDNVHDCFARNRMPDRSGEKNPKCKLTTRQVMEIRANTKDSHGHLARVYGVSRTQISHIRHGKSRKGDLQQ